MKRILSIDGGGIRGVFPAAFLADIEGHLDYPLASYFDLIAGTSTGGIIALGLGLGHSAKEILELYESEGPGIFSQNRSGFIGKATDYFMGAKRFVWGPKHDSSRLETALTNVFGNSKLGDASTRLFIPSWHSKTSSVYIFKTAHHERLKSDYKEFARDVAMATAAAPTYFREFITSNDVGLIDGGIWANNPVGFAVAEAVANLEWNPKELRVLTIGCLDDVMKLKDAYGAVSITPKLSDLFMAGQSSSSLGLAHTLTGDVGGANHKAIYRISQPVISRYFSLDNTRKIGELKSRAKAQARVERPNLEKIFFQDLAEPFDPFYKLN